MRRAFSAHRQVEGDLARRIDELRLHHAHRLDEAAEAVSFFGEAAVCQVASRMTWSIRAKDWNDFPVSQKWFAVGETHAHLEYLRLRGRIRGGLENGMFRYRPA